MKQHLKRDRELEVNDNNIYSVQYRPFCKKLLYFDPVINERVMKWPKLKPSQDSQNYSIIVPGVGNRQPFSCFISDEIVSYDFIEKAQCFPRYYYPDKHLKQDNILNAALDLFQDKYKDKSISKDAIFYYVYGILHHLEYRERYAQNLALSLPKIPLLDDFWAVSEIGKDLAQLHTRYLEAKPYPLKEVHNPDEKPDHLVEKMSIVNRGSAIRVNEWLTLEGIPEKAYKYRLGSRDVLAWLVDRYQVSMDKKSGIVNDPNDPADKKAIPTLIKKVVTVSLQTQDLIGNLPDFQLRD